MMEEIMMSDERSNLGPRLSATTGKRSRMMVKPLAVAAATLSLGASATPALAANGWYWSQARAEAALEHRFSDVYAVGCIGRGASWRGRYTRFTCSLMLNNGRRGRVAVHVLSARNFYTRAIR
jgi:hypothetical protein